jgi:hypothetical protein
MCGMNQCDGCCINSLKNTDVEKDQKGVGINICLEGIEEGV